MNNVKTELDLQWQRTFYTMPYGYELQANWYPRLVDYDFCTCETKLNTTVTNVKIGDDEVSNLAKHFPMRHILNQNHWNYRPYVKLPFQFTPQGSQVVTSELVVYDGMVQFKNVPVLQWRSLSPYLFLKNLKLPNQLNDGYQPADQ